MDIFDQPFYERNKFYLYITGFWPYDSLSKRHQILLTFFSFCILTQIAAKVNSIVIFYEDTELLFDSLPPLIGNISMIGKATLYYIKMGELRKLLDCVRYDWGMAKGRDEIKFLQTYAEQGKRLLTYYVRFISVTMGLFMLTPVIPRFLGIGNTSLPRPLPHNVNYFVNNDDYYYPILIHAFVSVGSQILVWIATDGIFIAFVQHACGMFCIIEYRLSQLLPDKGIDRDLNPLPAEDTCYNKVRECVKRHIDVLSYTHLMESMYSTTFLYQAGLNTIIMSITAVRATTTLSSPQVAFRQLSFSIAQIIHLLFECYQGQRLIDHSCKVENGIMNSVWYLTSFKSRRLIHFMLMRAQIPSILTAGKLFVVSMEFFSAVIRTSVSYFTVLGSVG